MVNKSSTAHYWLPVSTQSAFNNKIIDPPPKTEAIHHKFQRTARLVVRFKQEKEIATFDSFERNQLDVMFSHFFPLATFG